MRALALITVRLLTNTTRVAELGAAGAPIHSGLALGPTWISCCPYT